MGKRKQCRFCGEPILSIAKKCKHCGSLQVRKGKYAILLLLGLLVAVVGGFTSQVGGFSPGPETDQLYDTIGRGGVVISATGILMFFIGAKMYSQR